jgi:hypothetical protein
MNVRYFHLRVAKVHILFLSTKFIFNFLKNIFDLLLSTSTTLSNNGVQI